MATVTKYDVLSPDGFSISFDEVWDCELDAKNALNRWIKNYERQGYYRTGSGEKIPLDELETWCTVVTVEVETWVHPEQKSGDILLLNVKDNEVWGVPPFCESVRRGNVAYTTNGKEIVLDMKPLFGKLK